MKNFLTFRALDAQCRKQAGDLSTNDIQTPVRQNIINSKIMKIYGVLDGINDPFYNRSTMLTAAADQEMISDITAINSVNKTITRGTGSFVAGSVFSIFVVNPSLSVDYQWFGRIVTAAGNVATYERISGADGDIGPGGAAFMAIIQSLSESAIDVSGIYFKNFTAIYDYNFAATIGQIRVYDEIKDPRVFFSRQLDYNALKRVAWYQQGNTILLSIGANAYPVDQIYADYRGKPNLYTSETADSEIDIPPELNQALTDEVTSSFASEAGKQIPADVAARLATYEKTLYAAHEADKTSKAEKANK